MILVFLACAFTAFVFSGIESGVLAINRVRLRYRALCGVPAAVALDRLLARPARLMATVVVVTTLARIGAISILYAGLSGALGPTVAAFALLPCLPLFAFGFEFLPKALFRRFPYNKLVLFARLLFWTDRILSPLAGMVQFFGGRLLQLSGPRVARGLASVAELRRSINAAETSGFISPLQKHFLHSVLNAREVDAAELAVHAADCPSVTAQESVAEIYNRCRKTGAELLPVVNSDGAVEGVVRVFDLLIDGIQTGSARSYARRVSGIEPDLPLLEALQRMRSRKSSPAVVVAPGGDTKLLFSDAIVARLLLGHSPQ